MRIALDCMGGDEFALSRNVAGAVEAAGDSSLEIILVGHQDAIEKELLKYGDSIPPFKIEHAGETVAMDESPSSAIRKKRTSSMWIAVKQVREKHAEAVVTAGNTGAAMAMAKIQLGTLQNVERPAIITPLPTPAGFSILVDAGANVDCKPKHLYQFAVMGNIYARNVCQRSSPRVGLLSVGQEESKGNQLTKETYALLKESSLNFLGNIEGRDIFTGTVDVIVCDGFVGNIVLKSTESLAEMLENLLRTELQKQWRGKIAGLLIKPIYRNFKKKLSHSEYGGAPLLGINGVCIISHGSSSGKAIRNALFCARDFVIHDLNEHIKEALAES
jgi:glycerol-3-phosphate acyltransferase PlsX